MRTAGRVCKPPQTARRQVSGQGWSGGAPRAGRGPDRGAGGGAGQRAAGSREIRPERPNPARREEGGRPFPSSTAPGSAARNPLPDPRNPAVLTPTYIGKRGLTATATRNPQPGGSERGVPDPCWAARPRKQGSGRREEFLDRGTTVKDQGRLGEASRV